MRIDFSDVKTYLKVNVEALLSCIFGFVWKGTPEALKGTQIALKIFA